MSTPARNAYEAWSAADVQAREAESRLAHSWQAYFDGGAPPPGEELIHEVSRLRARANERLSAAMVALGATPHPAAEPVR